MLENYSINALTQRFNDIKHTVEAYHAQLVEMGRALNAMCPSPVAMVEGLDECIRESFKQEVKCICHILSSQYQGESLKVLDSITYYPFVEDINNIDVNGLCDSLYRDAMNLEQFGLAETARKLGQSLKLNSKYNQPFERSGQMICKVERYGSNYAVKVALEEIKQMLVEVETVTGQKFNLPIFDEVINALNEAGIMSEIPSRTRFGSKADALSLVWFKEVTEFCFSMEAYDSLQAFLVTYAEQQEAA